MTIKYEKTPVDLQIEQHDLETNMVLKHLRNLNAYKYNIGDVLIREDKTYDNTWKVHLAQCGLPYKYVYVFENELGVGYIRRMSINGSKFVEKPVCVVEFNPNKTRFRVDPAYLDHLLLAEEGEEFDFKTDYKNARKKRLAMYKANEKLREKIETEDEALAFMESLQPGDEIWMGWANNNIEQSPGKFVKFVEGTKHNEPYMEVTGWRWHTKFPLSTIKYRHWYKTKPQFWDELL